MRVARRLCALVSIFAIASCASAPDRADHEFQAGFDRLTVCAMDVSNAPQTNTDGYVVAYAPTASVHGVTLMRAPAHGCVSSGFGPRRGGASDVHRGLDIFTKAPKPVHAGGDGVVEEVQKRTGFGRSVLIRHSDRVQTRYAHLSAYASGLKVGDRIWRGEVIGRTGDTGNATAVHLHYEIIVDGVARDPLRVGR